MFTKTELDTTLQMIRNKKLFLDNQSLTIQSSNDVGSEADLTFFRGSRKHFENAAHFWLCCINWLEERWKGVQLLMVQRYPDDVCVNVDAAVLTDHYVSHYSFCQNISPESFQEIVEVYSLQLKSRSIPHTYEWEGHIQQAMQMSNKWNDRSFVAETESEFLAFFWETGA